MAAVTASQVTINRAWTEGGTSGKEIRCREVTLNLSSQGTAANYISADVLELDKIEQAHSFRRDDDDIIAVTPSYDGLKLLVYNLKQATDANREDPADVTDIIRGIVKGY